MKKERFEVATLVCSVGKPGDILACRSLGRVMMAVAVGSYSFLGWEMQVVGEAAGPLTFQACKEASAVQWHYMTDLDDYLAIPTKPVLSFAIATSRGTHDSSNAKGLFSPII